MMIPYNIYLISIVMKLFIDTQKNFLSLLFSNVFQKRFDEMQTVASLLSQVYLNNLLAI